MFVSLSLLLGNNGSETLFTTTPSCVCGDKLSGPIVLASLCEINGE